MLIKMKHLALLLMIFCFIGRVQSQSFVTLDSTTLQVDTLVTGLDVPWEIQWGPDDHLWMTERFGRISRINPESKTKVIVLDISDKVYQNGESGLLGLALHPDFPDSSYVYAVYTYLFQNNVREKLVRYYYNGATLEKEEILLDNIPGKNTHDGSRLVFSPDKKLFMTTGDARNTALPQDINSLAGKVLRLELNGAIPDDNPIPGSPVYSWGHRNPQGLSFHPNGKLYSSEHGPSNDDEFQIIYKGRNYGWPDVNGFCNSIPEQQYCADSNIVEPLTVWTPTIAPSDLIYYKHDAIPEFKDAFLMATLKAKRIIRLTLNETGDSVIDETHFFTNNWGRIRDIEVSPDGTIYLATNGASWGNVDPFTHTILSLKNVNLITNNTAFAGKEQKINVWPNPGKGSFMLEVDHSAMGKEYSIHAINGEILKKGTIESPLTPISLHTVSGIYFLTLENYKPIKILVQ